MYYVYILKSQMGGSTYVGFSQDPTERLKQHNQHLVRSTKLKVPFQKIWQCGFVQKQKALEFEKYLKTGSGIAFMRKHLI